MRNLLLLTLSSLLISCNGYKPPNPQPSPMPTSTPSPAKVLANCDVKLAEDIMCDQTPKEHAYRIVVDDAQKEVWTKHPELFDLSGTLNNSVDGAIYIKYVYESVRRRGLCAGNYYNEEIAVYDWHDKFLSENYDLILANMKPRYLGHEATCVPVDMSNPASDPVNGPFLP